MGELSLAGCRAEPLASYLKALGIFRLVAEQADPDTVCWWRDDTLRMRTALDIEALIDFLAHRYRPTPLLAPWNKGSGFGKDDSTKSPKAADAVERIERSHDPRLAEYRDAIAAVQLLRRGVGWYEHTKEEQVALCRNRLPDRAIMWLDAAVVLTTDSRVFPPLLGTGGNDGRFDFASNFMQRLGEVFGLTSRPRRSESPERLAAAALTDEPVRLDRAAIGQFDPGAAGGPGSSPLGAAESLSNLWDFILLLEGVLLFASGAVRRLSGATASSVPFMVRSTPAGHHSAAGAENTRGELWAPLWKEPASYAEVARLLGEGRADFGGRQSSSSLDIARSLATLGVDRGIEQFVRHAFVERNGLATFAVPLDRFFVRERGGVGVLAAIDEWASRARGVRNPPASLGAMLRRLDDAQFALARKDEPARFQEVLFAVAEIDHLAARSNAIRARVGFPIRRLPAKDWLPHLDDGSDEHELAVALASLRDRGQPTGLLRNMLVDLSWSARPPRVQGLGARPIAHVLADCLTRLAIDRPPSSAESDVSRWLSGTDAAPARLAVVERFIAGEVDDDRLQHLFTAYALLDWRGVTGMAASRPPEQRLSPPRPFGALVRPFFHAGNLTISGRRFALGPETSWPRLLAAGRNLDVARRAIRRLRTAQLVPLVHASRTMAAGVSGRRVATACLVPLSDHGASALLGRAAILTSTIDYAEVTT